MSDAALPRPRQVTMAAWMIIAGSMLVVVTVFERIAGINDLETQTAIEQFLAQPPGDGLGLDVPTVQAAIRVFSMIAGACAAAAVILGFHVLRRHKGARLALTVLAVPLFLSGLVTGGFLSSLVAAAALMLWLEPSRDWFAGRSPRVRPAAEEPAPRPPDPGSGLPPSTPPSAADGPRPHQGFGTPVPGPTDPDSPPAYPSAHPAPGQPAAYAPPGPVAPPRRPAAVVTAAVVTWVFAGLTATLLGAAALLMFASPDLMIDEMNRQDADLAAQGVTTAQLQTAIFLLAGVAVVWSAAVSAAAIVLVVRRKEWARLAVLFSAAVAGLFCLLGLLSGQFLMMVPLAGAAVTFSLLLRREVRDWVSAP